MRLVTYIAADQPPPQILIYSEINVESTIIERGEIETSTGKATAQPYLYAGIDQIRKIVFLNDKRTIGQVWNPWCGRFHFVKTLGAAGEED